MAAKVCYNCGRKLHGDSPNCTNCGAHQWRKGTEKMTVDQLKDAADEEFRQAKIGKGEARDIAMEKSMFLYSLIGEKINYMIPKLESVEPMERCIRILEYIILQERRAEYHADERRQARYRDMMERLGNMRDNLVYEQLEKNRQKSEETKAAEPEKTEPATPAETASSTEKTADTKAAETAESVANASGISPKKQETPAPAIPTKLDELVDYAIFTVSEMDENGSWTFLGKPRSKNYMISMFSFLRDIKDQLPTLEQKERDVLLHVMFQVADSYEKGTYPFPQDPARAIDWHTEASERGLILSQLAVGDIYLKGSGGLRPQPEKALTWYEKALDANKATGDPSPKVTEYAEAAIEHIKYQMRK
ncbi:MAG TPA: hypothetical protein DCO72_09010 [Ruminococcus sp.]|nr:hypothetical protein [Ruminococcus sp.]